jgi:hypothetical protein
MKIGAFTTVFIFGVCGFPVWGASTRDELVLEVTASLKARDRAAFEECVNFEGADEELRKSFAEMEDQMFSWPTHYVITTERRDEGKAHATENGKNYTLNGDWSFFIDIYLSKPPSKGFVMPAGMVNGKCLILQRTEEKP